MPEVSQVHVTSALTNVSVKFAPQSMQFIADQIFPIVPVAKQYDTYYKLDPYMEALRASDDRRAPGGEATRVDFGTTTDTYRAEDHALSHFIPDEVRANCDPVIAADINAVEFLTEKIALNKEIALVAALLANCASNGTNYHDTTNEWDDYTLGDPFADISLGIKRLEANSGLIPNVMVVPYATWLPLKNHPDMIARVSGGATATNAAVLNTQAFADIFGLQKILVPRVTKNTANQNATVARSAVWGENDCYLLYVPDSPGLRTYAIGYTFVWNGSSGASQNGYLVSTWREEKSKSDAVQVERYYDQKIVSSTCAYRFHNTLS